MGKVIFSLETASLIRYWKHVGGVDVSNLYGGIEWLHLHEDADGLLSFHPLVAGDETFYSELYRKLRLDQFLNAERHEFALAAQHVPRGSRVLDVGCGFGEFAKWLKGAEYTGIDLTFDETDTKGLPAGARIKRQSLTSHLAGGHRYDFVSAFQVLEHVSAPGDFLTQMMQALAPGGSIIIAVPLIPSPALEIPALPINMPPHHLTFWTAEALTSLFAAVGLDVVYRTDVPPSPAEDFLFWARKFSWIRDPSGFARLDRYAIASMLTGIAAAKLLSGRIQYRGPDHKPVVQIMIGKPR